MTVSPLPARAWVEFEVVTSLDTPRSSQQCSPSQASAFAHVTFPESPGPGSYKCKSHLNVDKPVTIGRGRRSDMFSPRSLSPGPGAYAASPSSLSASSVSFGRAPRSTMKWHTRECSPGFYNHDSAWKKSSNYRASSPSFSTFERRGPCIGHGDLIVHDLRYAPKTHPNASTFSTMTTPSDTSSRKCVSPSPRHTSCRSSDEPRAVRLAREGQVMWQVLLFGRWQDYDAATCRLLDISEAQKRTVVPITCAYRRFDVNLDDMTQMSARSRRVWSIRKVIGGKPHLPVDNSRIFQK